MLKSGVRSQVARMYAIRSPDPIEVQAAVVDVYPVRCGRGRFASIECGVDPCDDRPRLCVGGSFAGEVSSVEFLEGGVDVVGIEHDDCR